MARWRGSIRELLNDAQIRLIDEVLANAPPDMRVDMRGARLNRYPGMLLDMDDEQTRIGVVVCERPSTETGLVLISNRALPEIQRAVVVIQSDNESRQQLDGHCSASRPGGRETDASADPALHYSVFQPGR